MYRLFRLARRGSFFHVHLVSIGIDGAICVVHNRGITICSNARAEQRRDLVFQTSNVHEVACVTERDVFLIMENRRAVYRVCRHCPEMHLIKVSGSLVHGAKMLRVSNNGVVWRGKQQILCNCAGHHIRTCSPLHLEGPGRIHYVSEMLPSGYNAVLVARKKQVTAIHIVNAHKGTWQTVDLVSQGVPVFPMMHRPMHTVGDMVWYDEAETNDKVCIRPETDAARIKRASMITGRLARGVPRRGRNHPNNSKKIYLFNDGVYVVEGGVRLTQYKPRS